MAIRVITEPNSGKYLPSPTDKDRPQANGFVGNFPGWSARPPEDMFAFGTFDSVRPSCAYPGAPGGITSRWPRCRKRGGIVGPLALGGAPGACSRERKRSSPSCEPLAHTRFYRHDRRRAVRLACRHWLTERADCGASRSTLAAALAAVKFGHLAAGPLRRRAEPCPSSSLDEARLSKLALKLERPS